MCFIFKNCMHYILVMLYTLVSSFQILRTSLPTQTHTLSFSHFYSTRRSWVQWILGWIIAHEESIP